MEKDPSRKLLFDKTLMDAAVLNVAQSIISEYPAKKIPEIALIGIQHQGTLFAERLASEIKRVSGAAPELGAIDITMYRDDIGMRKTLPVIHETVMPFDINGKIIILVDNVIFTGRTIRAALDAINDYGRPAFIRLAVLIDRGSREFPIRADYIGRSCVITPEKNIKVCWTEVEGEDAVYEEIRASFKNNLS